MRNRIKWTLVMLMAVLTLSGCSMKTVDQMYQLPKRSKAYSNLQSVMDTAMEGLKFSAPIAGDNQQSVQMADLNGDGDQEYLVYCKGFAETPLKVLIFDRKDDTFFHIDSIEINGTNFNQVIYVQMDEKPGVEIVVGHQISEQLMGSVSVYTFTNGESARLLTANYRKFLTVDMNDDGYSELFVLHAGQAETDPGIAELYYLNSGIVEQTNEVSLSAPADKLKRVIVGKLQDGRTAVFAASAVGETSLVTDIYTSDNKHLTNVINQNPSESGLTLRNYFIYADDIDNDGITELPLFITMTPLGNTPLPEPSKLIQWYAISSTGSMTDKMFTYYNTAAGWYLKLDDKIAPRITVQQESNTFVFYLWDDLCLNAEKLLTIHALTGQNREEQGVADGKFVLLKTDSVVYAATLESVASSCGITKENLSNNFSLIQRDWNFGEM